jgi:hypothetical protein
MLNLSGRSITYKRRQYVLFWMRRSRLSGKVLKTLNSAKKAYDVATMAGLYYVRGWHWYTETGFAEENQGITTECGSG